ncbi:MAG: CpcT/CpeT family chromophore lyase [Polyangiales bacterium]
MRRVVLGLMVVPAVVGVGYFTAAASPVEGRPAAKLARMLEGDFRAATGRTDVILRKACRVDAPALGDRAVYVEERFEHGGGRPYAQRLLVVSDVGEAGARVREFTFADPGAVAGACGRAERVTVGAADVVERAGCDVSLSLRDGRFSGRIEGRRCESVLNGATHAKRAMEVSEREVAVHDRGYTEHDAVAWGAPDAIRYARR